MLQWEWPETWDPEVEEKVREQLQQRIRQAMAKSKNAQIRGSVVVEELHIGSTPPELTLSSIRELSATHTALMVKLRYSGDACVTLKGLEINLDTVAASTEEADPNHSLPFYCPFEMKICELVMDGTIAIEIFQETRENPAYENPPKLPSDVTGLLYRHAGHRQVPFQQPPPPESSTTYPLPPQHQQQVAQAIQLQHIQHQQHSFTNIPQSSPSVPGGRLHLGGPSGATQFHGRLTQLQMQSFAPQRPLAFPSTPSYSIADSSQFGHTHSRSTTSTTAAARPGYGVLFGAGGRRAMRPPNSSELAQGAGVGASGAMRWGVNNGARASASLPSGAASSSSNGAERAEAPVNFSDVACKKRIVTRRYIKAQFFEDPLKSFRVVSNFGTVQGANSKIEGTLKMLLRPTIQSLMTQGIEIPLPTPK